MPILRHAVYFDRRVAGGALLADSKSFGRTYAIIGTVGVPGVYGGFETLAENLVRYHKECGGGGRLTVYCEGAAYPSRQPYFEGAALRYVPLKANGVQSVPYDVWSLCHAVLRRTDVILLLGVSGALVLPVLRLISRSRFVTNIDGVEWKRDKWSGLAKWVLRLSERVAVRWSHVVVADNQAIAEHVLASYGTQCEVIAYGGDHALTTAPADEAVRGLPELYALALCRIEPENNVAMILEAFSAMPDRALVFVGNWDKSEYGRTLRERYGDKPNLYLLDPVYEPARLRRVRDGAWLYVHGHSAGGTNPSLVEMMHFGIPVVAHGCAFNRYSTEHGALYFETVAELQAVVGGMDDATAVAVGECMGEIASRRYTWAEIGRAYFALMDKQ